MNVKNHSQRNLIFSGKFRRHAKGMQRIATFTCLLGMVSLSIVLAGDVSGTWAIEFQTPGGKGHPTATLKQDGEKLSGRYAGKFGESEISGSIKADQVDFVVHVVVDGKKTDIHDTGAMDPAGEMKGAVTGGAGDGAWTARKK